MTPSSDTVRILMYSHDTYGLGHVTRTLRIAGAIRNRTRRASILVLSGSPVAPYLPLPAGADLVKLPSVLKAGADRYRARNLAVDFAQIKRMRRNVIRSTAESFKPHLFLVDNVPLGMKGEIIPTLEMIRAQLPRTRIILNLRDILDDPDVIRCSWERDGVHDVLRTLYDQIYVLGDPEVFDAIEAYGFPADRTLHVGYATPSPRRVASSARPPAAGEGGTARVLLTAGGGGDGFDLLSAALKGLTELSRGGSLRTPLDVEVVTGPLMAAGDRIDVARLARRCGARIEEFVQDLPGRMLASHLVFSMAGYNTSCDILSHAHAAIIHPRTTPRVEQLIRARAFAARGIATMLPPDRLDPQSFAEAALRVLQGGRGIDDGRPPLLGGLERLADHLVETYVGDPPAARRRGAPHRANGGGNEDDPTTQAACAPPAKGHSADRPDPYSERARRMVWYWPEGVLPRAAAHD